MNIREESKEKVRKNKKIVLKEERLKERRRKESKEKKMKSVEVRKTEEEETLREVTVKIGLERINIQEEIIVKILLNNGVTDLIISLECARKKRFKLKKIERPIYVRNVDGIFNKKRPIEHIMKINIYY